MFIMASTESNNNHNFHQIGAQTQTPLVRARLAFLLKVHSVVTVAPHHKCTTMAATLPTVDHMGVWWT